MEAGPLALAWCVTGGGLFVILLEEAIERYALAAGDLGIRVERQRRLQQAARNVVQIERHIGELRLPAEVRHLWTHYVPQSFGSVFFDGLYRPEEVLRTYERDVGLGYPLACLPLAYIEKAGVWIELETPHHPGGRIYHTFYDDAELQLWCVDLSTLTHLLAETIEHGGVKEPRTSRPWIDVAVFDELRLKRTVETLAMPDEWRIPVKNRAAWPQHWRAAEGLGPVVAPTRRGPTHTVEAFNSARQVGRVMGTLVGRITGLASGGPIDGLVLNLSDDTSSVQLYASVEIERAVTELGFGVPAEFDVIGEPQGWGSESGRAFMLRRSFEDLSTGHLRLLAQMRKLDVSAAVTAIRAV
jgi:hypothetical protein